MKGAAQLAVILWDLIAAHHALASLRVVIFSNNREVGDVEP